MPQFECLMLVAIWMFASFGCFGCCRWWRILLTQQFPRLVLPSRKCFLSSDDMMFIPDQRGCLCPISILKTEGRFPQNPTRNLPDSLKVKTFSISASHLCKILVHFGWGPKGAAPTPKTYVENTKAHHPKYKRMIFPKRLNAKTCNISAPHLCQVSMNFDV